MEPKQQKYESISACDEHYDGSSTEVDESLMGDEKQRDAQQYESPRQLRRRQWMKAFESYRWIIDAFLLLLTVGSLGLSVLLLLRDEVRHPEYEPSSWQVGGDFAGAGPIFPTKVHKFEADPSFVPNNASEFFTNEIKTKWDTMMPAGTGWGSDVETFSTTTMTHQLHCIFMMARIYAGLTTNATHKIPADYHSHMLHCIDYLRQGVMCTADVALEPHSPSDSNDLGAGDGSWNGHHVCKDYQKVTTYLEGQIADGVRTVLPIDD